MKRVAMQWGQSRVTHEDVDKLCALIAAALHDMIPAGGVANVTIRAELEDVLQPAAPPRKRLLRTR